MNRPLIEIEGFAELQEKLKQLSNDKDKKKEILLILRQVAKPTLQMAQSLAPVSRKAHYTRGKLIQPRNLQKSIGNITGRQENPTILVGPRAKGSFNGWYGHFPHDGHNVYSKGYKRKHTKGANDHAAKKRTTANPYMRKAFEVTDSQVTADADKKITAFIQRRINRLSNV